MQYLIYIIEDEPLLAEGIARNLRSGYRPKLFSNALDAIDAMKTERPDLILLDIRMPGMDGIQALTEMKKMMPDVVVIMTTGVADTESVVKAMKLGAYDYIVKPLDIGLLKITISKALETIRMKRDILSLQEKYLSENLPCFIAESKEIQDVMELVKNVSKSPDTPVLILGESGTGKELLAGAIHYHSPNFRGPFVQINCAAVQDTLIESEIFGYVRGAFSGAANKGKIGLIEEAASGTLFLDEIGDLSLDAQAKLLRFLDSGEFYRVGSTKKSKVQTRIVAATNKDIENMIETGAFREDFFFRISVIKIQVPSLNQRRDDILPIARKFLRDYARKFSKNFESISPAAEAVLTSNDWKGNIRELKNVMERGVLMETGPELQLHDFIRTTSLPAANGISPSGPGPWPALQEDGIDLNAFLASLEKQYIQEALDKANGNETAAAQLLGMKYTTLRYRKRILFERSDEKKMMSDE
jgi:DNA-binding NtrC family response regulator